MARLQKIIRANGSAVSSINLPLELIEELGWDKGDNIHVSLEEANGIKQIVLWKEDIVSD